MSIRALWQRIYSFTRHSTLRGIIGGLVIAVSFSYLGYVLARNWDELVTYGWRVEYKQIALAFIYYSAALTFAILGWSRIMDRMTRATSPYRHLKYYLYSNLFQRLPAPLLYLFSRVYLYEQEGIIKSVTMTVSLLEWTLIVLSGIIVYLLTLPFVSLQPAWYSSLWPLSVVLVIGILVIHPRSIRFVFRLFGQKEAHLSFRYGDIVIWLVIYSLVWIGGGLMLYAVINSIYTLPLTHLPTVIGIWVLSGLVTTLVFATSAGLGLKEATLGVLLSHLMPPSLAVITALLMRVCLILFAIFWGIVALRL